MMARGSGRVAMVAGRSCVPGAPCSGARPLCCVPVSVRQRAGRGVYGWAGVRAYQTFNVPGFGFALVFSQSGKEG